MNAFIFPHIDPVAFSLGPIMIRWYALAYLGGFLFGWWYALKLAAAQAGQGPTRNDVSDYMPWCVLGVILGGRIGYILFYNFGYYIDNPTHIFHIWEGGMSFHGGLLGVAASIYLFARQRKFSSFALGDIAACVAPLGIFFGRLANFINGELYGRVTDVPWGVIFPQGGNIARHPSQLYEAGLEGVGLLTLLGILARIPRIRQRPGTLLGIFLAGYAAFRFGLEFFREPDAHLGYYFDILSLGQILTLPMFAIGVILVIHAQRKHGKT